MEQVGNTGTFIIVVIIALIPLILFIRSIQSTLKLIAPYNRKIKPEYVWITLIPLPIFTNIWSFILVTLVANSVALEYKERAIPFQSKPTFIVGLLMSITSCLAYIPAFKKFTAIGWFVFFFIYWARISQCKRKLVELQESSI